MRSHRKERMLVSKNILNFRVVDYSEVSQTGQYKRVYRYLYPKSSVNRSE